MFSILTPHSTSKGRMDYVVQSLFSISIYFRAIFTCTLRLTVKFSSYQIAIC
jgi:hypothetical protein